MTTATTSTIRLTPSAYHTTKELSYLAEVNGRKFELHASREYRNSRPGYGARRHAYTYYTASIVERFADGTGKVILPCTSIYSAPKAKLAELLAKALKAAPLPEGAVAPNTVLWGTR